MHYLHRVRKLFFLSLLFVLPGTVPAIDLENGAALDITSSVQIRSGGFRKNLKTGELVQAVTVTNRGRHELTGNIYLIIDGFDPKISLKATTKTVKLGETTAKAVALRAQSGNSAGLKPGQQLTTILRFSAADKPAVRYQARVLQQRINNK